MRISIDIGKPQVYAALLLLTFFSQSLWLITHRPLDPEQAATGAIGRILYNPSLSTDYFPVVSEGIIPCRIAGIVLAARDAISPRYGETTQKSAGLDPGNAGIATLFNDRLNQQLVRLPFVLFGLWLGGAIWWVARRLYGDAGGYVALSLFSFSPLLIGYSAMARPEIVAAWAVFGIVFTAMGVGHTLYAPARKWFPRISLLGIAIAVAMGSNFSLWIAVPLALGFMFYLAPGRRWAAVCALALSASLAAVILWACYGFHGALLASMLARGMAWRRIAWDASSVAGLIHSSYLPYFLEPVFYLLLFSGAMATYAAWRRARYFGTTGPLLSVAVLILVAGTPAGRSWNVLVAIAPLVFVFIAGIAADLLETNHRNLVRIVLFALLAMNAIICLLTVPAMAATDIL